MKKIILIIILMFPHVGWSSGGLDALDGKSIICKNNIRVDSRLADIYGFRFIGNKVSGDRLLTENDAVTIKNFNTDSVDFITVDFIGFWWGSFDHGWRLNRETLILYYMMDKEPTDKYQCKVMPDLETYNKEMEAHRLEHFKKLKNKLRKNQI